MGTFTKNFLGKRCYSIAVKVNRDSAKIE